MRTIVILLGLFVALCTCAQQPTNIDNFAITEKAFSLRGQGKFKEAYDLLKPLADQGDLQGIYRLAELYDYKVYRPNAIRPVGLRGSPIIFYPTPGTPCLSFIR